MALQEADFEMMQAFNNQNGYVIGPTKLIVHFFSAAILNHEKSVAAGAPKFDDAEWIEIRVPGDKDEIRRRPVRWLDKQLYAPQYAAFKQDAAAPQEGTPIDELQFLTAAQKMEYKAAGLRTAENLRDMNDAHAQKFMGMNSVRQRCKDFLDAQAGQAPLLKMRAELEQRDAELASLRQALKEQGERIDQLGKAGKRG